MRSTGPVPNDESFPEWSQVNYRFAATERTTRRGVDVVWYDGKRRPDEILSEFGAEDAYANASLFVGEERALLVSPYEPCRLFTRDAEIELSQPDVPDHNHWHEFVDACYRNRSPLPAPWYENASPVEVA